MNDLVKVCGEALSVVGTCSVSWISEFSSCTEGCRPISLMKMMIGQREGHIIGF